MTCCNLLDGKCRVASTLANQEVRAHDSTCAACKADLVPMTVNNVTKGLAIASLVVRGQSVPDKLHPVIVQKGPGTELRKLISWFPVPKKTGCRTCKSLETKMNRWGPAKCSQKIDYILGKLEIAAKRRSVPFVRFAVKLLVETAISKGASA